MAGTHAAPMLSAAASVLYAAQAVIKMVLQDLLARLLQACSSAAGKERHRQAGLRALLLRLLVSACGWLDVSMPTRSAKPGGGSSSSRAVERCGGTPHPALAGKDIRLCCPGGGILFFWQLGALRRLAEARDLSSAHFVGYSSGALVSVLAACGVDPAAAVTKAHALAEERGVWRRPLGLAGIWGGLVRRWLEDLLPDDAAARCSGRVHIVVTRAWGLSTHTISSYESRGALIDAAMASAHVPFFLDWRATTRLAAVPGAAFIDGHLGVLLAGGCPAALVPGWTPGSFLEVDYSADAARPVAIWEFLKLTNLATVLGLVDAGHAYAGRAWA